MVDGEMQADTAVDAATLTESFPFSALKEPANVLIFPNLSAGNIAYKLLHHLCGATAIGPILVGMAKPVHVLEQGAETSHAAILMRASECPLSSASRARRRSYRMAISCSSTATAGAYGWTRTRTRPSH